MNAFTPVGPDGSGTTIAMFITPATPGGEPAAILLRVAAVALGLTAFWSAIDPITDLYRALGHLTFTGPGVEPTYPSYGSVMSHPRQVGMTLVLAATILALAATGRRRTTRPTAAEAA